LLLGYDGRMFSLRHAATLLGAALLAACGARQAVLVTDDSQRWPVGHFSVAPPPGGHWYHAHHARRLGVSFVRDADREDIHTVVAHAERVTVDRETTIEVFVASVKRHVEGGTNEGRLRFVRGDYHPEPGSPMWCVAYEAEVEDRGVKADTPLAFVVVGRVCRHPSLAGEGAEANVSERGRPGGGMSGETREQAAVFLASLKPE